ncbi:MAG TPA: tetratricopeptide repeat protein, partial [Acidimicrobiia bacterium]|nr:tetratricopeptide repeat protein [Acidimicrobiia bacterium]
VASAPRDAAPPPRDARAELVVANLPDAPPATDAPIVGLVPLAPAGIPNDLPDHVADMKAPAGEHLVPVERLEAGSPEKAIAEVDAEVAKNPDRLNRLSQAMIYIASGRPDGLARLDRELADFPDYARAWAAKGYIEVRAGHPREAEAAFTKAIALDPHDAEALRNRGILRAHEGRDRDAYPDLVASLAIEPNDVDALSELAQLYSATGHQDDARPILERVVQASPDNPNAWLDLSLVQPPAEALASIDHALALAPELPRAHVRLCTVSTELGTKQAIAACDDAVKLAPGDPWAWMGRGLARYQLAGDRGGLADIDRAIAMSPNDAQFYVNRYIVRSHAGMLADARKDLEKACQLGKHEACDKLK